MSTDHDHAHHSKAGPCFHFALEQICGYTYLGRPFSRCRPPSWAREQPMGGGHAERRFCAARPVFWQIDHCGQHVTCPMSVSVRISPKGQVRREGPASFFPTGCATPPSVKSLLVVSSARTPQSLLRDVTYRTILRESLGRGTQPRHDSHLMPL